MRFRSVQNIVEEVKILNQKYGVTLFLPEDDLFTADKKRVMRLLAALRELNIPNVEMQFPDALSVNTLDESIIDEMARTGMKIATFAIESGSDYVQKQIIRKNCNLKKAKRLVEYAHSKGLITRCYFILGFPHETKEQMRETVEYAKSLVADWCVLMIATPLVGSEMYDQFVEMGCIQDNIETWSGTVFDKRHFDTEEITAEELNDFVYRANLERNFLCNPNIVNGNFARAIQLFKDIVWRYPFHIIGWYCLMESYKGLGDFNAALRTEESMRSLIRSDSRAADMYAKYCNLMPAFKLVQTV
jgi:MoaA/NifB/PqqE/SkfB family radical SAM enzyme